MKFAKCLIAAVLALTACSNVGDRKYLWIDCPANFMQYANNKAEIAEDCMRIADIGFTDIVVDVRPTCGDVLFKSEVAPSLRRLPRWRNGRAWTINRTADFDYLQAFIEAGHKAGLRVHAAINVFVGGWRFGDIKTGMLYKIPSLRQWCSVDVTPQGILNECDNESMIGARFLDPTNKEVHDFLIKLISELAEYKDLDGIVLDRCHYNDASMATGCTDNARRAFAEYLGHEPSRWPVFDDPGQLYVPDAPDSLEVAWLTFRCKTVHDFIADAEAAVHAVSPKMPFGAYVGAWLSDHYRSGVNWADKAYDLSVQEPESYGWAGREYNDTGIADLLDYLFVGSYAEASDIWGDEEWTMQGFTTLARKRARSTLVISGADIGGVEGFQSGGKEALMPDVVHALTGDSGGIFIFDLSHVRRYDYWEVFKHIFVK